MSASHVPLGAYKFRRKCVKGENRCDGSGDDNSGTKRIRVCRTAYHFLF